MGVIHYKDEQVTIDDNTNIQDACMDMGIPFGCQTGICGTCIVDVKEGMEHVNPLTDAEKEMGLTGNLRLACQCVLKKGTLKIDEVQ